MPTQSVPLGYCFLCLSIVVVQCLQSTVECYDGFVCHQWKLFEEISCIAAQFLDELQQLVSPLRPFAKLFSKQAEIFVVIFGVFVQHFLELHQIQSTFGSVGSRPSADLRLSSLNILELTSCLASSTPNYSGQPSVNFQSSKIMTRSINITGKPSPFSRPEKQDGECCQFDRFLLPAV